MKRLPFGPNQHGHIRLTFMCHQHFMMYKPPFVLSQFSSGEDRQLRKKRFLGEYIARRKALMPIGRLDEKSEGLLLLTTDGHLSNRINTSGIEKEYWVQIDGLPKAEALKRFQEGLTITLHGKPYLTKPCSAVLMAPPRTLSPPHPKLRVDAHRSSSWLKIVLTEGKFRQIRKMTALMGWPTSRLLRVRVGNIYLDGLCPGAVRPISDISALLGNSS